MDGVLMFSIGLVCKMCHDGPCVNGEIQDCPHLKMALGFEVDPEKRSETDLPNSRDDPSMQHTDKNVGLELSLYNPYEDDTYALRGN